MHHFFYHLIGSAVGSTLLLALAVMLCAFLLEDATIIIVGVLAADGTISIPLAFIALYAGMFAADILLYALGSLVRTHPRLAQYADHEFTAPFRDWLEKKYTTVIFSGHFVPGLRFTTYSASGFFRFPFSTYLPIAMVSGVIVEAILFTLSYLFGSFSSTWGHLRWGVAAVFILVLFFIARHNILSYRARRQAFAGSDGDTRTP